MIDKLDNYLKRQVYSKNFLGCEYYIYCDKDIYTSSVGNNNSIRCINGIINNLVINILISRLIDEGEINLQTKVSDYIDNLKYDDILIIHLLTHSSGLVNSINNKKFDAGSNVIINKINYKLLKDIIEKIYNTNIELLARSLIFEPMNMYDTKLTKNHICTTINDLSHFVEMIINNGFYNKKEIIKMKYIDMWFTPLFTDGFIRTTIGWLHGPSTSICKNIDYTLNTIVFDEDNCIIIDRDNELCIILLFNELKRDVRNNICKYIFKLLKEKNKIY